MIPLIIAGKKYRIKAIDELTTAEFIELSKIENVDLIKYIAWQTGINTDKAFFAITDSATEAAIGKAPDITKLKPLPSKLIDYKKTLTTVGQRHQVESCNLSGFDLLVFTLAVSQACSVNIDDVYKLRDQYLQMDWRLILPAGFFFYKKYRRGKRSVRRLLKKLLELTRTLIRKKEPVLKS